MLIEINCSCFNVDCGFKIKSQSLERNVLMNLKVQDEWYTGKKTQDKHQVKLTFTKH
jgi:hypothetical protein